MNMIFEDTFRVNSVTANNRKFEKGLTLLFYLPKLPSNLKHLFPPFHVFSPLSPFHTSVHRMFCESSADDMEITCGKDPLLCLQLHPSPLLDVHCELFPVQAGDMLTIALTKLANCPVCVHFFILVCMDDCN